MRIHCLQHVPFEGPAAIGDWAHERGHKLIITRLDRGQHLPAIGTFDWLLVMGGPMGVADRQRHAWMSPEIELVAGAVDAGRRVLGICLGAQLLAHALGARVYPAFGREIGWFGVKTVGGRGPEDAFGLPPRFTPLHWHGDTFDLPAGAVHLAAGPLCGIQAFAFGPRVVGLQFHLESTPDSVAALVDHCAGEIGDGKWEMAPELIVDCQARCRRIRPVLHAVLDRLAAAGTENDE